MERCGDSNAALIHKGLRGRSPHLNGEDKLPYLLREITRHGKTAWYVRRGTGKRVRVNGEPGTEEFRAAYREAVANPPKSDPNSFVYFAKCGDRVKIGFSKNPRQRVKDMRTGSSQQIKIYYATPGGRELERELHKIFEQDRIRGEWFTWSSRILEWIDSDEAHHRKRPIRK